MQSTFRGAGFTRDGIVEGGESCRGKAAGNRLGEARLVNGAHGKRQPPLQDLVEHAGVG